LPLRWRVNCNGWFYRIRRRDGSALYLRWRVNCNWRRWRCWRRSRCDGRWFVLALTRQLQLAPPVAALRAYMVAQAHLSALRIRR